MLKTLTIISFLFMLSLFNETAAQHKSHQRKPGRQQSQLHTDMKLKVWNHRTSGNLEQHSLIFTEIAYDLFQFIKIDNIFQARFELSITIIKGKNEIIYDAIVNRTIEVTNFKRTNSKTDFYKEIFKVDLEPGSYTAILTISDKSSSEPLKMIHKFDILPSIRSTEVLFYKTNRTFSPDSVVLSPVISNTNKLLSTIIEYYPKDSTSIIKTKYQISNTTGKIVYSDSLTTKSGNYRQLSTLMPTELPFGQYSLDILSSYADTVITTSAKFRIQWTMQTSAMKPDFNISVGLLKYLISKTEWKKLEKMSQTQQQNYVESYWKKIDPDPQTTNNPLQNEFYKRTAHANANFAYSDKNGWQSDRGRTYILYGPPSNIERPASPTGRNQRYELWTYNSINRKFLFIDKHNNGKYELVSEH